MSRFEDVSKICAGPITSSFCFHCGPVLPLSNVDHGAELFRNCAICHGPNGGGTIDGSVAHIAGQHFSVMAKQLVDYRHEKRWDIRMDHFSNRHLLPDAQTIADVAGYFNHLAIEVPPRRR